MKKKTFTVLGLMFFLLVMVLAITMPVHSRPVANTCCPQTLAKCVVGGTVIDDHYDAGTGMC